MCEPHSKQGRRQQRRILTLKDQSSDKRSKKKSLEFVGGGYGDDDPVRAALTSHADLGLHQMGPVLAPGAELITMPTHDMTVPVQIQPNEPPVFCSVEMTPVSKYSPLVHGFSGHIP